jgi:hypothetical protein
MVNYVIIDHMTQEVIYKEDHIEENHFLYINGKDFSSKYGDRLVDIIKIDKKFRVKKGIFIDSKTSYRETL